MKEDPGKETSNIREKGNGENGGKAIGGMGERNERKQKKTSRVVCEFCVAENCGVKTEEKRREGKKEERLSVGDWERGQCVPVPSQDAIGLMLLA